ncbi:acid-sensing ion channel 5 [Plakobranchus ocellatus]|uniref:Acid-sensing ion channel 5 n=1 Tax=Plakobranchus ocellatus TaxID=259542 RepID=A0AAV3ZIA3_9GAST|nr:acid-sensing ion channel 5 [Plakobranchus ocellatus]
MSGVTFQTSKYDPSRTYLKDTLYPLQREESVQVEMPFSESKTLTQRKQQSPSNLNEEQQAKGMLDYYFQSATIHGISHTCGPQYYFLRRPIWFILLAVMTISLVWAVYGQINNFYEYPINTVTQVTLNTVLPFPAVTICNLNQFMRDRVPDTPILSNPSQEQKEIWFFSNQVVKVIQYQSEYFQLVARMKNQSDNMFDLANLTDVSGEQLQRILFDAAPSNGICYTFNGPDLKPEQRYKAVGPIQIGPYRGPISLLRTQVILRNKRSYYARYPHAGIKRKCLPKPFKAFTNDYCEDTKMDGYRNRLTVYNTYSVVHCYRECVYKRLESLCNCRYYLSPAQIKAEDLLQCSCPRECEDIDYSADISYANIFSQFIEAQAIKDGILLLNNSLSSIPGMQKGYWLYPDLFRRNVTPPIHRLRLCASRSQEAYDFSCLSLTLCLLPVPLCLRNNNNNDNKSNSNNNNNISNNNNSGNNIDYDKQHKEQGEQEQQQQQQQEQQKQQL